MTNPGIPSLVAHAKRVETLREELADMAARMDWGELMLAPLHYYGKPMSAQDIGKTLQGWGVRFEGVRPSLSVGASLGILRKRDGTVDVKNGLWSLVTEENRSLG